MSNEIELLMPLETLHGARVYYREKMKDAVDPGHAAGYMADWLIQKYERERNATAATIAGLYQRVAELKTEAEMLLEERTQLETQVATLEQQLRLSRANMLDTESAYYE